MKYYEALLELGCLSRADLVKLTGSASAAAFLIREYLEKGYMERIKFDYYAVISLETRQPVMNRYQIGSKIAPDAFLSLHSAFEVYGYANQVFNEVYVSSRSKFQEFDYNGILYHRLDPRHESFINEVNGIRVTGLEQTVVDSIASFEKIAGLEEVLRCIELIPSLNADRLLKALSAYRNRLLYKKCGYILSELNSSLMLPESFFAECERKMDPTRKYLTKQKSPYRLNKRWQLYAPDSIEQITGKGVTFDAV